MSSKKRSVLWYVLPALLSIVGGIISYLVLKNDDPEKAKNCLWLGIILFALYASYYIVFSLMTMRFEFS